MNPFLRSYVSIARDCSKIAILPELDEPFCKIVCVSIARNCSKIAILPELAFVTPGSCELISELKNKLT